MGEPDEKLVLDALPYIDTKIDDNEEEREAAMCLVDDELEIFPPTKDYLEYLPINLQNRTFVTELIENEHNYIERGKTRSTSPSLADIFSGTPSHQSLKDLKDDDLESLGKNLNQLKIKIEYRQRQLTNLELIKSYGQPAWEQYLNHLSTIESELKSELEQLEAQTQKINWSRKTSQERIAKNLEIIQKEWESLSDRNRKLANEVRRMKSANHVGNQ